MLWSTTHTIGHGWRALAGALTSAAILALPAAAAAAPPPNDNFGKGGTFSFTPTKAGKISYVCTIHPGMTGTLTVQ